MKSLYIIAVGKLKDKNYQSIENEYLKRITNPSLQIIEIKTPTEDKQQAATEVLKKVSDINKKNNPFIVLLCENGETYDSPTFANWLTKLSDQGKENIFFIIGGAAGHGEKVLAAAQHKISLSALTMPHRMARIILVEQLYRAQTLQQGHPYHK